MTVEYCGPGGFQTLAENAGIKIFNRGTNLSLTGTQFTDETLTGICQLKSLRSLSLSGTQITDEGVAQIRRTLPDCQIRIHHVRMDGRLAD